MGHPASEFSSKVDIELTVDGLTIPVRQLAREFIITSYPFQLNPSAGTIVLHIDDVIQRMDVYLAEGIDPSRTEQPIVMQSPTWSTTTR